MSNVRESAIEYSHALFKDETPLIEIETQMTGDKLADIRAGDILRVYERKVMHLSDGLYMVTYGVRVQP
jgi:hypothetical protein